MSYDEVDRLTDARATTFTFTQAESERILFPEMPFSQEAQTESYPIILEQMRKKETRYLLTGTTLSQYYRQSRIPRGLRIKKIPTLGRENPEFCKKWCSILNRCSLDLMLLVIENENEKLINIRKDLDNLQKDMTEALSPEKLQEIVADCDTKMETYRRQVELYKMGKYRRDALDYRDGRVYTWLSGRTPKKGKARQRRTADYEITSESSEGLSTDTESINGRFLRPRAQSTSGPPSHGPPASQREKEERQGGARGRPKRGTRGRY